MNEPSGAKAFFNQPGWVYDRARQAMPILLRLASSAHRPITYQALEQAVARQLRQQPVRILVVYGKILDVIGIALNRLSDEWREEIPPLTTLAISKTSGLPSSGVDVYLERYNSTSTHKKLTVYNRAAMIERATQAVYNYARWPEVAAYFGTNILDVPSEAEHLHLPPPMPIQGGESHPHLVLKKYVSRHPELFNKIGQFENGELEHRLYSGDEIDVFFHNSEQVLAVEIKTSSASQGELTRGIFQCVKYRAVLRAMYALAGELIHVQSVLVTPQILSQQHEEALKRLGIARVAVPSSRETG